MAPYAAINGDMITIHNVRNFNYRTETDFDARWETRTYNLSKLDSVGSHRRLLGGQSDCTHHDKLRLRGKRLPRGFHRDA